MKKTVGILLGLATLVCTIPTFAQQDVAAKKILADVSKKYDSYQSIQAGFSFSAAQASSKAGYTESGTLYLDKKNNKYQITV